MKMWMTLAAFVVCVELPAHVQSGGDWVRATSRVGRKRHLPLGGHDNDPDLQEFKAMCYKFQDTSSGDVPTKLIYDFLDTASDNGDDTLNETEMAELAEFVALLRHCMLSSQ